MTHIEPFVLDDAGEHDHLQLAVNQSALHIAKLALARWGAGDCSIDMPPASCQSRWLAAANSNFTRWLADGGFAQILVPEEVEAETNPPSDLDTPARLDATAGAAIAARHWREIDIPRERSDNCTCAA